MANKNGASALTDNLYSKVESVLKKKETLATYKTDLDKYLAANIDIYYAAGPGVRPVFSTQRSEAYVALLNLTPDEIKTAIKSSKELDSNWLKLNEYNIANALATRYFLLSNNAQYLELTMGYLIVKLYPSIHFKYFKYNVNESCMQYTLNNLSMRYNVKKTSNLWQLLMDTTKTALDNEKEKIISGTDKGYWDYIQSVQTRFNSIIKNISKAYYDNHDNQRYLKMEHESYEEDNYYEADSNSFAIKRISDKVTTHMVVNGPDAKLIELSAKMNKVSVNQLRNFADTMIVDSRSDEIYSIVESLLFLYLFNDDGELHSADQVKTNDFMIYCLKVYRRSNTTDKNIVKIKTILDKWLDELGLMSKTTRTATIISFRKALFTFFVMEIQQNA